MNKSERLHKLLIDSTDDKEKVDLCNSLADVERNSNTDKAFKLHSEALNLAQTIDYPEGKAKAYWGLGICKRLLSQYKEAI